MSTTVIFAVGVLVFLVTVYGAVVSGGLFRTTKQLEDQPELRERSPGRQPIGPISVPDDY